MGIFEDAWKNGEFVALGTRVNLKRVQNCKVCNSYKVESVKNNEI